MIRSLVRALGLGTLAVLVTLALSVRSASAHARATINVGELETGSIIYKVSGTTPGRGAPPVTPTTVTPTSQAPRRAATFTASTCGPRRMTASGSGGPTLYLPGPATLCATSTAITANPKTTPSVSPAGLAASVWSNKGTNLLPSPHPYIAPGEALAGLPGYLEVRAPLTASFSDPTRLGTLVVHARAVVYVHWGDGTPTTGPYHSPGAPWPNGTITHYWDYDGTYRITVSEDWSATWSLAGASGTLGGLQTYGTIDNFHVGQLESVRNY